METKESILYQGKEGTERKEIQDLAQMYPKRAINRINWKIIEFTFCKNKRTFLDTNALFPKHMLQHQFSYFNIILFY